jgi:hypothetical protein
MTAQTHAAIASIERFALRAVAPAAWMGRRFHAASFGRVATNAIVVAMT